MNLLTGKTAIITGASKGIGKAISLGLAAMKYQTILIGRNKNDLENVAQKIVAKGGFLPKIIQLDITDVEAVNTAVQEIHQEFGRIDILVNNAGIYVDGTSDDISEIDFSIISFITLTTLSLELIA